MGTGTKPKSENIFIYCILKVMEPFEEPMSCSVCKANSDWLAGYPINPVYEEFPLPHCLIHGYYKCSKCQKATWFNGISWCHTCKEFTCLDCGKITFEKTESTRFRWRLVISCIQCKEDNPSLDQAELEGVHPFQIGDIKPTLQTYVWLPILGENKIEPKSLKEPKVQTLDSSGKIESLYPTEPNLLSTLRDFIQRERSKISAEENTIKISEKVQTSLETVEFKEFPTFDLFDCKDPIGKAIELIDVAHKAKVNEFKILFLNPEVSFIIVDPPTAQKPENIILQMEIFTVDENIPDILDVLEKVISIGMEIKHIGSVKLRDVNLGNLISSIPLYYSLTLKNQFL